MGDIVDYGRFPEKTIALLRERRVPCIRGNHDRWALLAEAQDAPGFHLTPRGMAFLAGFPTRWCRRSRRWACAHRVRVAGWGWADRQPGRALARPGAPARGGRAALRPRSRRVCAGTVLAVLASSSSAPDIGEVVPHLQPRRPGAEVYREVLRASRSVPPAATSSKVVSVVSSSTNRSQNPRSSFPATASITRRSSFT